MAILYEKRYLNLSNNVEILIAYKLKMLREEFLITPNLREIEQLKLMKNEIQVENMVRKIIMDHLECD